MQQKDDEASNEPLTNHEEQEMTFYLDNALLLLAEQIQQDQKDLYSLEGIQYKVLAQTDNSSDAYMNAVYRHDFSDIVEVEEEGSAKALEQGESKNAMLTDDVENWKKEATTTFGFSSLLQGSTTLATIGATLISLMVF